MTVIDALVVTLGLDGSKFAGGAKEVEAGQKKIGAGAVTMGKDTDAVARQMVAGITRVRNEFLALLAVFTAGRGIKSLTGDMIEADAAIGRTAKNAGMATEELSALSHAGERSGGTFAGVTASVGGFIAKLEQFKINGQGASDILEGLAQTGVGLRKSDGGFKSMTELFTDLNTWAQNVPRPRANQILAGVGLDEGSRNLILSTQAEFNDRLNKARELGNPSGAWSDLAGRLQTRWSEMGQRFDTAWRTVVAAVGPSLLRLLERIGAWIDKYGPAWEAGIGRSITKALDTFEKFLSSIDQSKWDAFWTSLNTYATAFENTLKAIYNWSPPDWLRKLLGLSEHPFQILGPGEEQKKVEDQKRVQERTNEAEKPWYSRKFWLPGTGPAGTPWYGGFEPSGTAPPASGTALPTKRGFDHVRQAGVNCGVAEVANGQAAMVVISVATASMVVGISSAMASVCM